MQIFDSHSHYNDEKFNEDRNQVLLSVYNLGITRIVNSGYNVDTSKDSIKLAQKNEYIYATCGISPNDIPENELELIKQVQQIKNIAKNDKVVAIGEIGLDYYWNKDNKELQKKAFIYQIKLANELKLPIVIHTRDAHIDTIDILKNSIKPEKLGVFHCCPLNQELVKQGLELGFYISLAGPITFKNSKNANEIIKLVPLDKMLIETDSPYLSPEPLRGKRNDSRNLKYILEKIASVKEISVEEVAKITYENANRIFLPEGRFVWVAHRNRPFG